MEAWNRGDIEPLWEKAVCPKRSVLKSTDLDKPSTVSSLSADDKWRSRIVRAASEGNIRRAASILIDGTPILPITADTVSKLKALHPQAQSPPVMGPTPTQVPDIFTAEEVKKAINTFPGYSAPGPSGLRPSHLQEALNSGEAGLEEKLLNAITKFCNLAANARLPLWFAPFLSAARLIPSL